MRNYPIARPLLAILLAVVLLVLTSACGSPASDRPELLDADTTATTEAPAAEAGTAADVAADPDAPDAPVATIATSDEGLTVYAEPDVDATVVTRLSATTEFGSPRALLVVDEAPSWVEVQLPIRPNGSTGWVRETAVDLVAGEHRVEVDLAARHLTVFEDDRVVLETPVAVGSPDAPTPTGTFSIVDLLQSPDPGGSYGPFALGLSAHSDTFSEFAGGDGQIGIHGTDDPSSIGQAVSHGCVRVPNDIVGILAQLLPLGTPVIIR